MRYVLDSNVALKWVLSEVDAANALALRVEYGQGLHEFLSPDVFPIEVAHALTKAERRGSIRPNEGLKKMSDIFTHMPDLYPYLPLLPRAFALSSQARIGVYDCLYVALAEREGCALLTANDRLPRSLPAAPIVRLASRP